MVVAVALGAFAALALQVPQALASGGAHRTALAAVPTISSFRPVSGPAGTVVTVNGTGFAGSGTSCTGTRVTFHGIRAAACTFVSSAKLKATVPLRASTGRIRVTTSAGSAASGHVFTVTPSVRLSPGSGPPTTMVTVSGGGFGAFEGVDVYFGTTDEVLAGANANGYFTGITVKVPASAMPGVNWFSAEGRHSGLFAQRPFTVATTWSQYGRVPSHTHSNPFENVLGPGNVSGLDEAWRFQTSTQFDQSPAVANGSIFTSDGTNFWAINASTGNALWRYSINTQFYGSPAVANGVVYIGSVNHNLYALNAATGAVLWTYATGDDITGSPAVANGAVYFGSYNGTIYALSASTGALLWTFVTGRLIQSSPAVANGVVYAYSGDGNLYALRATTGAKLWSYPTHSGTSDSPAVANGVVYMGSVFGGVLALSASTGAKLWSYATSVSAAPAVANGIVYIGTGQGNSVLALNAYTGANLWSYATGGWVFSSPVVANGVVYIGSWDGTIAAVSASTGAKLWSYLTNSAVGSPAVANGTVYVGSGLSLYAFDLTAGLQASGRPRQSALHPNYSLHVQR